MIKITITIEEIQGKMSVAIVPEVNQPTEIERATVQPFTEAHRLITDILMRSCVDGNAVAGDAIEPLKNLIKERLASLDKLKDSREWRGKRCIIHHLHHGAAPCGMLSPPKDWPEGHYWEADWALVNCAGCLKMKDKQEIERLTHL